MLYEKYTYIYMILCLAIFPSAGCKGVLGSCHSVAIHISVWLLGGFTLARVETPSLWK